MIDAQTQARKRAARLAGISLPDLISPLLCTFYPGWFVNKSRTKMNITALNDLTGEDPTDPGLAPLFAFQKAVSQRYDGGNDFLVAWRDVLKARPGGSKKGPLRKELEKRWPSISHQVKNDKIKGWKLVLGIPDDSKPLVHQKWRADTGEMEDLPAPDHEILSVESEVEVAEEAAPESAVVVEMAEATLVMAIDLPVDGTQLDDRPGAVVRGPKRKPAEDPEDEEDELEPNVKRMRTAYEDPEADFLGVGYEFESGVSPDVLAPISQVEPDKDVQAEHLKMTVDDSDELMKEKKGALLSHHKGNEVSERTSPPQADHTHHNSAPNNEASERTSQALADRTHVKPTPDRASPSNPALERNTSVATHDSSQPRIAEGSSTRSIVFLLGSNYGNGPFPNNEVRLQTGPLNDFLNMLPSASFVLGSPLGASTNLDVGDKWLRAVKASGFGAREIGFNGSVDPQSGFAQVTEITTSIPVSSTIQLQFSTANTFTVMHSANSTSPGGIAPAFLQEYNLLALGLSSTSFDFQLSDLLALFGPTWLQKAGDTFELPGIEGAFTFKLSGGPLSRNALYFQPDRYWSSYVRLQFQISDSAFVDKLKAKLPFLGSIDIHDTSLICLKRSRCEKLTAARRATVKSTLTLETTIDIHTRNTILSVQLWLVFQPGTTKLVIRFPNNDKDIFDKVLGWLIDQVQPGGTPISGSLSDFLPDSVFSVEVHQVEISLRNPARGVSFGVESVIITLELQLFSTVFMTTLTFPSFRLHAELWTTLPPQLSDYNLNHLPWWQTFDDVFPYHPENVTGLVSLKSLLPGSSPSDLTAPNGILIDIEEASFDAEIPTSGPLSLRFVARIDCDPPQNPDIPTLSLGSLDLTASYLAKTDTTAAAWALSISTTIILRPRDFGSDNPKGVASTLSLSVSVDTGIWTLSASAQRVQFAALYQLFDAKANDTVMDMLEEMSIPFLNVTYTYGSGTSSLLVTGALQIHTLVLNITYSYEAKKPWSFQAQLGAINKSGNTPLKLTDLIGQFDANSEVANVLDEVPFVRDVAIPSVQADPAGFHDAPVQFSISSSANAVIMWFRLEIDTDDGALSLLFVQYKPVPPAPAKGAAPKTATPRAKPKRLLRVSLDHLPSLPNIPIVGQIGQPVDSIQYVLVQDPQARVDKKPTAGFTRDEIQEINNVSYLFLRKLTHQRRTSTKLVRPSMQTRSSSSEKSSRRSSPRTRLH
jgi:hypothetical protein